MVFEKIHQGTEGEFEQIVFCNDSKVGLKAIIGVHSTVLGPATGGCRMWAYESEQAALTDVLRLSKGMTYKASISGLNWGGGKAVIIGDPKTVKTPELLRRYGEFVDRLGGTYITAKDVGIGSDDLRQVKTRTKHVLGIDGEPGSSGDPSPATAWGVYHGMLACAKHALGSSSLKGLTIAIQGLGSVAFYLIEHLKKEGANVIGCDIDPKSIDRAVKAYGIEIVKPEAIYDVPCEIFAPSALGGAINRETLSRLKTRIVAGAANNQLATPAEGAELLRRGITYAPDYAINAGGLINIYNETMPGGYDHARAFAQVARIEQTIAGILERASADRLPPHVVADQIAEERVAKGRQL
ncbi:MAG TPA: Glu/Leu/Phe/Val dehydrogenase [Bdellovibrionota bacterium]|nr:Glu/Leu/Phe/Val dehydrogenase [Bdellovibrionota bacterium]